MRNETTADTRYTQSEGISKPPKIINDDNTIDTIAHSKILMSRPTTCFFFAFMNQIIYEILF